jgi:hypothetical protein
VFRAAAKAFLACQDAVIPDSAERRYQEWDRAAASDPMAGVAGSDPALSSPESGAAAAADTLIVN